MLLKSANFLDVLQVASNMREWDRREIYATRWNEDPSELVQDCMASGRFAWTAGLDRPIAAIGATPMHPTLWGVWMFATDNFHQISISLTKFVRRVMMPALVDAGALRAECRSMEGHESAQRWLKVLGARDEGLIPEYGKGGEDFRLFAWRKQDVR
jgi:hypothetical protein